MFDLQDGSFTATCFFPFELFESLLNATQITNFFNAEFPDFVDLVGTEALVRMFMQNPVGPLISIKVC